jgi:saccharopine dehydrogenase-like NADP-dependent oxidoreductase
LKITDEDSLNLEKETRGQYIYKNWREARNCLITAAVMSEVVKRVTTKPDNLVKKIRDHVTIPDTVKSLKYGRKYEAVAVEHYMENHIERCKSVHIESRGLPVNPK